jgi:hypothetical protein
MKMKENTSRAVRRHHVARLKNSRKHYFVVNWWDDIAKRLGVISQYPKKCSCPMCGNPRKWLNERTIAEMRDDFRVVDGMNELMDND